MGWIIAGSVVILILLLTLGRVTVYFDYKEDLFVLVSFLWFTLFKIPAEKKKIRKRDKKVKKTAEEAEEKAEEKVKKEKPSLSEILELVKLVMNSLGKPLRKILKRTEFSQLTVKITCGGEDAAKAALNYGRANIAVGSALGFLDSFFTLKKVKNIDVAVDFYSEKTTADCYFEVRLTLAAALAFAFTLLGRAVKNYLSDEKARSAVKKMI